MIKKTDSQVKQGYTPKAIPHTCGNCRHCVPVMGKILAYKDPRCFTSGTHMVDAQVSQKCGIGEFEVKKMGACDLYEVMISPNS